MIDLRSDTVTKPTPEMREYMMKAEVGDDVFADDPTVNALQEKVSGMFGKEAGLFVPSGTMSNQLAVNLLTEPGNEIIIDETGHVFNYEATAAALLSSVQLRPVKGENGILTPEVIEPAIRTKNEWDPHTKVIAIENTTNKGGGVCYTKENLLAIRKLADKYGLMVHLDGARIWNAHIASGIDFRFFGSIGDTISVCFSKGLGAPVGSMLLSTKVRIAAGRRMRKMLGGGMRQIGILAAAADYAVDHHLPKLAEDHRRGREFAEAVSNCSQLDIDMSRVQSNIIIFDVKNDTAESTLQKLQEYNIFMAPFGPKTIRATFHLQIDDEDLSKVIDTFQKLFN